VWLSVVIACVITIWILFYPRLNSTHDHWPPEAMTPVYMRSLWLAVIAYDVDHGQFPPTDNWSTLISQGYLGPIPRLKDGWGNPMGAEIVQTGDRTIFRILSRGANGIDEHGGGDDIVGEVEKVGKVYHLRIIANGQQVGDEALDPSPPATQAN
jgi:hypothetical protein